MNRGIELDITIPIEWTRVELVRKAVGSLMWAVYGRGDLRDSMSMVSAELLENAMKYAPPDGVVRFSLVQEKDNLVVMVRSSIEPGSPHVASLRERVAWIGTFDAPAEAYMAALAEVFDHKDGQGEGGLGLVRVAYEGGCSVSCDTTEPGIVIVRATRSLAEDAPRA